MTCVGTDDTKRVFNTTGWLESTSPEFYITVQWELGEQATPFDRSFGDELQRCKRYYQTHGNEHTSYRYLAPAFCNATTQAQGVLALPVTMRAAPTTSVSGNFQLIHGSTGHSITLGTKELSVICRVAANRRVLLFGCNNQST